MNKISDEVLDEESPEVEIQKAYDSAVETPWSISAQTLAMSLSCGILDGTFGPQLKSLQTKGTYNTALYDTIIVLWILSLTPDEILDHLAYPSKKAALKLAYEFAEKENIRLGTKRYFDGIKLITSICGSIFASFYALDNVNGKAPPKNDLRQAGSSDLPIQQSKQAGKRKVTS
jgi:hypothetical protein